MPKRMSDETFEDIRARHVRRFGDPTYVAHDDIGALLDEVQACWSELRRLRMDNEYIREHVGNVVGYVLAQERGPSK